MSNLTLINNVLMQPVQHGDQLYFTSHYFHREYRNNAGDQGKYKNLADFNVLIRSIEAYPNYVQRGDIVELKWAEVKESEVMENFHYLFKHTGYRPIMLINATAQVALTHHLDDEISKQISVSVNEGTAKQTAKAPALTTVAKNFKARLSLASDFGLVGSEAKIAANRWTLRDDGVDVMASLGVNLIESEQQSAEITATEIATALDLPGNGHGKAANLNLLLWNQGYLESRSSSKGKKWVLTKKGEASPHLAYCDVAKGEAARSSVQAIKYYASLIEELQHIDINSLDFKALKKLREEAA